MSSFKLFIDSDGVIADFDTGAEKVFDMHPRQFEDDNGQKLFWKLLRETEDFFFNLPLMPDAQLLWDTVKHLDLHILTGCPHGNWAQPQKIKFYKKHFNTDNVITCASRDKRLHKHEGKINVLVDDWPKYKDLWEEDGGIFILHTSVQETLEELKNLGVI